MKKNLFVCVSMMFFLVMGTVLLPLTAYGAGKISQGMINKEEAIRIGTTYLQSKKYAYEIDWSHPQARLDKMAVKSDGSLTSGLGKRVFVWRVWFLPVGGLDLENTKKVAAVDINAQTGEIFTKYSFQKL